MTYAEKRKDPRWQERRLRIMDRDGFACRHCGRKDKTLNVHHAYYRSGADPWDYEDAMLTTLCEDCHEATERVYQDLAVLIACTGRNRRAMEMVTGAMYNNDDYNVDMVKEFFRMLLAVKDEDGWGTQAANHRDALLLAIQCAASGEKLQ